jgi:hypothetical protein
MDSAGVAPAAARIWSDYFRLDTVIERGLRGSTKSS